MSGIQRYFLEDASGKSAWMEGDDDGEYVLHSEHIDEVATWKHCALVNAKDANELQEEVARLRAEANGLSEALTDALACEQDYLREIYDLRAEVDALRLDAERYRWLRNDAMSGTRHDPAVLKDGPTDCCDFMFGDELDEAIDAAIGASA